MDTWLNDAEQKALNQAVSNDARVLYLMGLRPTVDGTTGNELVYNKEILKNPDFICYTSKIKENYEIL